MSLNLIYPPAEAYAAQHTTPVDSLLLDIEENTKQHHQQPWMLSGHLQGKFLEMISCLIRPERILEIGTMTGYSAICLAKGLQESGYLHTIEKREEDVLLARKHIISLGLSDRIHVHHGDAKELLPSFQETWDLVFIDADKTGYIDYYNLVMPQVRKGGLIIADNVLYHGEVLSEERKGKNARAIHAFNQHVQRDEKVDHVLVTIRDGLMLIRKK